jgi:FtsZ-interacting cell division protein ZipA
LGNNKIWIIVGAVAIVVLGGWFFMSGNDAAEGVMDEPAAIEGSETDEDQYSDEEEGATEEEDGDD